MECPEPCPLPEDPVLAEFALTMREAGLWSEIVDSSWRLVYMSDDLRLASGGMVDWVPAPLGAHVYGAECLRAREQWWAGPIQLEAAREAFAQFGPLVLADTPGGRDELRRLVDPRIGDLVDELEPGGRAISCWGSVSGFGVGASRPTMTVFVVRLRDATGRLVGTALNLKPEATMSMLATLAAQGDLEQLTRIQSVAKADRRPAAILFADLESSSPLARKMSTASYFSLVRRMARATDECIVGAGGLVGRHVGDGVVAFFLAEAIGSESAAARACVQAAKAIGHAMADVAVRSGLSPEELTMRFGMHWGSTLYVGQISTCARTEATALGDAVNETARIEACATGGLALASKDLLERLAGEDALALGLRPDQLIYTPLGELPTATDKARRDAPAIAVCAV